jgi:hypothetical protein
VTGVDLHPEELLDRVRRGSASADEQRRAAAHLARCLACRAEHVLINDGTAAAAPVASDAELVSRVQARARRTIHARLQARKGRRRAGGEAGSVGRTGRLRFAPALAAFVLLAGAVAAAAPFVHRAWRLRREAVPARVDRDGPLHSARASGTGGPAPLATATPADEPGRQDAARDPEAGASGAATTPARRSVRPALRTLRAEARAPVAAAKQETAAELFAHANQARRDAAPAEVIGLYRRLQLQFAASREAAVSHVALGRWLLDRMHDPAAALAQFDAYLHQARYDTLQEEALVGRAMALQQLGRARADSATATEERRAWEALLAAYPRSTFAARARARLEALR